MKSYALTEHVVNGVGFHTGQVVRLSPSTDAFGDCLILGFSVDGDVLLARPYAVVSSSGTTSPRPMMGAEEFSVDASKLASASFTRLGNSQYIR